MACFLLQTISDSGGFNRPSRVRSLRRVLITSFFASVVQITLSYSRWVSPFQQSLETKHLQKEQRSIAVHFSKLLRVGKNYCNIAFLNIYSILVSLPREGPSSTICTDTCTRFETFLQHCNETIDQHCFHYPFARAQDYLYSYRHLQSDPFSYTNMFSIYSIKLLSRLIFVCSFHHLVLPFEVHSVPLLHSIHLLGTYFPYCCH